MRKATQHLQHALNLLALEYPTQYIKSQAFGSGDENSDDQAPCPVCMDGVVRREMVCGCNNPNHALCEICMENLHLKNRNPRCPLCRGPCLASYRLDGSLHKNSHVKIFHINIVLQAPQQCSWRRYSLRVVLENVLKQNLRDHFHDPNNLIQDFITDRRVSFHPHFQVSIECNKFSKQEPRKHHEELKEHMSKTAITNSNLVFIEVQVIGSDVPNMDYDVHAQRANDIIDLVRQSMGAGHNKPWCLRSRKKGTVCTFRFALQYEHYSDTEHTTSEIFMSEHPEETL